MDSFIETVRGQFPASTNAGAARHWADENGVPMPDRSIGTLFWVSLLGGLFGLDHFYLRSPLTGILKLITLGGVGLWWLWDVLQIATEKERVQLYGLSTPLDITTGIAQGMITDTTRYTQPTSFMMYAFLAMIGLEALAEGKFALLIRRLVDAASFVSASIGLLTTTHSVGVRVFSAVMAAIFGIFLFLPWMAVVTAVVSGAEEGITISPQVDKLVNYFSFYTRTLGTHVDPANDQSPTIVESVLREEFGYNNVTPAAFREKFRIMHREESTGGDGGQQGTSTSKWIPALWMGPLGLGTLTRLVSAIPIVGSYVKFGIFNAFGDTAAARQEMLYMNPTVAAAAMAAEAAGINTAALAANPIGALASAAVAKGVQEVQGVQKGGAHVSNETPLSTEAKVLGAAVFAIIAGGGIKGLINYCVA